MSLSIPVVFFCVDKSEVPTKPERWSDVADVIGEHYERRGELDWHESMSRNWWHQFELKQITDRFQIIGLEFADAEVACLEGEELQSAAAALDSVIAHTRHRIPDPGHGEFDKVPTETFERAFEIAQPSDKIWDGDLAYDLEGLVGFYAFLKSLRQAIEDAIRAERCLLYAQLS